MDFLKTRIIAHRGVYDNTRIYENTVSSIERCIKLDIPVFLDVSLLKDNKFPNKASFLCLFDSLFDEYIKKDKPFELYSR